MTPRTAAGFDAPESAVAKVCPGRWGVAVSGGADSVALLRLAASRDDLALHVVHLNHQTRGHDSDGDAAFVADLAGRLGVCVTIRSRNDIEATLSPADRDALPRNPSAKYRSLRLALYRSAAQAHGLRGVLLAHHADDQAETVVLRLLRGTGYQALAGTKPQSKFAGLMLRRPLLKVRRQALLEYLSSIGQSWRDDASNATSDYARNRVRRALAGRDAMVTGLLRVADSCRRLNDWVEEQRPALPAATPTAVVAELPDILARPAVAEWMMTQGVPADEVSPDHVSAVIAMCRDAAMPPRLDLPGKVRVSRSRGVLTTVAR